MLFESKRLLELAGLPSEETSNLLKESSDKDMKEFSSNDGVTEDEKSESSYNEEPEEGEEGLRETIRSEIESMWASGQIFGKRSKKNGEITLGFTGIGFRK